MISIPNLKGEERSDFLLGFCATGTRARAVAGLSFLVELLHRFSTQKRNLTKLQLLVQPMPPSASRCFLQAWYLDSKYFKRIDEFLFIVHGVPATKCIQVSTTASLRTRASPLTNGGVGESNFPMSFAQRRFWTFCLLTFLQCVAGMVVSTLCREYITNPEEDQIKREQVYRSAVPGDSWVGLSDTMLYETFQVCT